MQVYVCKMMLCIWQLPLGSKLWHHTTVCSCRNDQAAQLHQRTTGRLQGSEHVHHRPGSSHTCDQRHPGSGHLPSAACSPLRPQL